MSIRIDHLIAETINLNGVSNGVRPLKISTIGAAILDISSQGDRDHRVISSSASATVTLPTSPSDGCRIDLLGQYSALNGGSININNNGTTGTSGLVAETHGSVSLIYSAHANAWFASGNVDVQFA